MSTSFDFVVIGAGTGGEAAANKARELGATVAIVDRRWFGGSCPHVGCLPSKSLLHGRLRAHKNPAAYDWPRASDRRDYMVNRDEAAAEPDDAGHVTALEKVGAVVYRGEGRSPVAERWRSGTTASATSSRRTNIVIAVGSHLEAPIDIPGIDGRSAVDERGSDPDPGAAAQPARPRRRPDRLRARPGLRSLRRPDDDRPVRAAARPDRPPAQLRGHPRDARGGRRDRPDRGTRGPRAGRRGGGRRARHRARRRLDGRGPRRPARGRAGVPARRPRAGALRHRHVGRTPPFPRDGRLRVADGLWVIGDPAGPELHTHQAHYQGEMAVRMALGEKVMPDYRALPRATYTDPEAAFVGVTLRGRR